MPVFEIKIVDVISAGLVPPIIVLSIVLPETVEFITLPPDTVKSSAI